MKFNKYNNEKTVRDFANIVYFYLHTFFLKLLLHQLYLLKICIIYILHNFKNFIHTNKEFKNY